MTDNAKLIERLNEIADARHRIEFLTHNTADTARQAALALQRAAKDDARFEICAVALSLISLIRYGGNVTFENSALPKRLSDFLDDAHAKLKKQSQETHA